MSLILSGNTGTSTLDSSNGLTFADSSLQGAAASPYVLKNKLINGDMRIDQRNAGASSTITSGNQGYTVDRWVGYSAGSSSTYQRVAGSTGYQYALQITGAAGNTTCQIIQRIESLNCYDLASQTVTLSLTASSSTATSMTIYYAYPSATDNWSSTITYSSAITITINSTPTRYSTTFTLPSGVTNGLLIQIVPNSGALTSGTFTITGVQLEQNTSATPFERRLYNQELANCQRYFGKYDAYGATAANTYSVTLPTTMRAAPTCTTIVNAGSGSVWAALGGGISLTGIIQGTANSLPSTATISCSAEL